MTSEFKKKLAELNSKEFLKRQTEGKAPPAKKPRTQEQQKSVKKAPPKLEATKSALKGSTTGVTIKLPPPSSSNRPIGALKKLLIDTLLAADEALTIEQLSERSKIQLLQEPALLQWLQENDVVEWFEFERKFKYKPKHQIQGKEELLRHFKRTPSGTVVSEVRDAYKNVVRDIEALKAEGKVYCFFNHDLQQEVVYPVDDNPAYKNIMFDMEIATLWRETKLPTDPTEFSKALREASIKTAHLTAQAPKKLVLEPMKKQKARRAYTRATAVTNVHMPELHMGPQPDQID